MEPRRRFLKLASALVVPAASLSVAGSAPADDGTGILGAWSSVHTLPFPPGSFREFLSFSAGGVFHETNSFLHTASNLDFSSFGLPSVVNASDGTGNWTRSSAGNIQVVFRKLLFDESRQNFGDLRVTGTVRINDQRLHAEWHIQVLDPNGNLILDFGNATSDGQRLE